MPEGARYKHVTHPPGGSCGWVAQKYGVCYRARFASQLQAVRWIAGRMGVSVESLRRPGAGVRECVNLKVAKHAGVTHSRGRWIARARGKVLGRYANELDAAHAVAKALRVGWKALKKPGIPNYFAKRLFSAA